MIQLGREADLCLEELRQVARFFPCRMTGTVGSLASIEFDASSAPVQSLCGELGGAIRAIRPLVECQAELRNQFIEEPLFLPKGAWAVSAFSPKLGREREMVRRWVREILETKPGAHGREERPAPGDEEVVPAKVHALRLDEKHSEICLWRDAGDRVQIGLTEWVYSPEEFAGRDIGKPVRPRRRGLLPPKLARQMINLARTPGGVRLLDPFCGAGVVLLEGLSMGFEVAGSDNRDEAIEQTRENLQWMQRSSKQDLSSRVPLLKRLDVRQLSTQIAPLSYDMVVGEGDLGPPIRGALPRKAAFDFAARLEPLYVTAFAEIRTILKPGGRVSLAVPFWQPDEGDPVFLKLARRLELTGYQPVIPEKGFDPILYRRKDQRVGRAIYVLESPR
jgi:tRNA (guanine10-N2)-dimethyltransferase